MDNLLFSPAKREGAWTLDRILELFPRLRERRDNSGRNLSGGEQKMLAVARALIMNPRLLLMDEPSEGLAPLFVHEIGHIVGEIAGTGVSVLLVEQNIPLALSAANRCYIFSKGQVVYNSTPQQLRTDRDAMHRYLGV
jgi:branched-chain amino acid transport system ATP-binding protein